MKVNISIRPYTFQSWGCLSACRCSKTTETPKDGLFFWFSRLADLRGFDRSFPMLDTIWYVHYSSQSKTLKVAKKLKFFPTDLKFFKAGLRRYDLFTSWWLLDLVLHKTAVQWDSALPGQRGSYAFWWLWYVAIWTKLACASFCGMGSSLSLCHNCPF